MTSRQRLIVAIAAGISILALFLVPPVGFIACIVMLMIAPPWGRSIAERTIISLLVLMGVVAIAIPRASELPLTQFTAHLGLAVFTAIAVGLRYVPRLNRTGIPRPRLLEVLIGLLILGLGWWLVSAYIGRTEAEILAGLISAGWDNHGHFLFFSNTYMAGQTFWPTADGSVAWMQYYPALHASVWSTMQLASETAARATRTDLLWPYVQWSAISFTVSMGAFAWIAGDLAPRVARLVNPKARSAARIAAILSVLAVAAFALLGSPQNLFNAGFTSYVMAVAALALTTYLSARSWRSATQLGWFLIPLGALVVNGLWTALVIGLVPAALVVAVAMHRVRKWLAPVWIIASAVLVGGTVWLQSKAITGAPGIADKGLLDYLGAATVGMTPFNMGAAIAAPFIAVIAAIVLIRSKQVPMAAVTGGTSVMVVLFLLFTFYASDTIGTFRLVSYYPLKTLNALLLLNAPLLAAGLCTAVAFGIVALRRRLYAAEDGPAVSKGNAVLVAIAAVIGGVSIFGYVGQTPDVGFMYGFSAAPGIEAADWRAHGVQDSVPGEALIAAEQALEAAQQGTQQGTSLMWDGGGILPNLWLATLNGTLSQTDHGFYRQLPDPPYGEKGISYVEFAMRLHPELHPVILTLKRDSAELVDTLARQHPDKVTLVKVPMRSSPLCLECSL